MRPYNPLPLSRELPQQRRDICAGALEEDLGRGHDARRILPAQGLCLEGLGYEYKDALGLGLGCYCGVLSGFCCQFVLSRGTCGRGEV